MTQQLTSSAGKKAAPKTRRLIEEWLPIAEIGIESLRERTPMTPFPAPNRLHVWWARRPLVASHNKNGKPKIKKTRGFRAPRSDDDNGASVQAALDEKLPEWEARNVVPDEDIPDGHKTGDGTGGRH